MMKTEDLRLPGDDATRRFAAVQWLRALGFDGDLSDDLSNGDLPDNLAQCISSFAPNTLKQVFTGVMSLGKTAGRLGETMALLGHQEAAFRRLREEIGIPRAAPPEAMPRVSVVLQEGQAWWTPGRWIPDIIDRAAGRDVLRSSGDPIAKLEPNQLAEAALDHLFVLTVHDAEDSLSDEMAQSAAHVHVIDRPERWLIPGPDLPHAIFEAASYLHGVSGVFSDPPDHQRP